MNILSSMPNTVLKKTQAITLVAAFNRQQELLLLKRPDDVHCGGLWSLPGGKVEVNEMSLDAAVRELQEESKLSGKLWRHLGKSSHSYTDRTLNFFLFVCYCPDIAHIQAESGHVWVKRDELVDYPMPEANQTLMKMLFIDEMDDYLNAF